MFAFIPSFPIMWALCCGFFPVKFMRQVSRLLYFIAIISPCPVCISVYPHNIIDPFFVFILLPQIPIENRTFYKYTENMTYSWRILHGIIKFSKYISSHIPRNPVVSLLRTIFLSEQIHYPFAISINSSVVRFACLFFCLYLAGKICKLEWLCS